MKAVILERRGSDAAVLAENGTFIKVRHAGNVGEEIDIAEQSAPVRILRSVAAKFLTAAAIVLTIIGGSYHYMDVSVGAYVSIDAGGSSVELAVNRLGCVTSVKAVSDSDAGLAEALSANISGMGIEDAVIAALDTITDGGNNVSDDEPVIVGITSDSEGQAQSLENAIANNAELPVRTVRVSENEREAAHDMDIGGGLYVYGTDDAVETVVTEEQHEDIQPAATEAETTVIQVSETEPPVIELQENEDIDRSDETALPQNAENEIVQAPDMPALPAQSEQFTNEVPPVKPAGQDQTAPAPGEGEKSENMKVPDNMSADRPGAQNGQPLNTSPTDEGVMPPQDGQQPDNMPSQPPEKQNGQEPSMPIPGEEMPQDRAAEMSDTLQPPEMQSPGALVQR